MIGRATRRKAPCTAATVAAPAAAALVACLALPGPGSAQGGPGFLFGEPDVSIGFRMGYGIPFAGSDLFDETFQTFTAEREDFRGLAIGGEIAVPVTERWDVTVSAIYSGRRVRSEYIDYVDFDDNPIEQETWFRTVPVTVGARYHFNDRGRSIGRFAWVPSRFTPFVAGGVGVVAWRFERSGDFIDFNDPTWPIVFDRVITAGTSPFVHGGAGVSLTLTKNLVLSAEGRYGWARGDLGPGFQGYDDLDLTGLHLLAGISARF